MSQTATQRFLQDESIFSGSYSRGVFRAVWMAYRPWLARVILLLIMAMVARFLLLANTNVLGYWVDTLCQRACHPLPALLRDLPAVGFPILLGALTLFGFIFNTIFRIAISRTGTHAVSLFYDEVTLRASRFPMAYFDANPVGRMLTRFSSDYAAIFRMAGGPMGEFLCLVFDLILMVVLTGIASPWFLPLIALALVVNFMLYRKNLIRIRTARRTVSRARSPAIAHFSETVQGAGVIRVFGRESAFVGRFLKLIDEFASVRLASSSVIYGFSFQMTTAVALLVLATGLLGGFLVQTGRVSVGSIGVAFTFVMMSSNTVASFFDWLSNLEEALTGFERLDEYLRHPLEPHAALPPQAQFDTSHPRMSATEVEALSRHPALALGEAGVEISHLSLRYRPNLPLVLHDIDLSIAPGEHVGIIGRTGSGKSSLIQSIFHLYPFDSGDVSVGGFSPLQGNVPVEVYRSLIALIPQEPLLFHGSLKENLTRGSGVSDETLLELLRMVGLQDLLQVHGADVLNMQVHERGANLSQGQRQLLALARALARRTPVIVLDEATSAVDPASEARLADALRHRLEGRTRIVVAHRLGTIRNADRIVWLEKGRIHRVGTPAEVLPEFEHGSS